MSEFQFQVKQGNHNNTQQVGMCLYNTMVLSVFGLIVSLLLEDNVVIVYGLTSGCIILGTTVNLFLVTFAKVSFPKLYTVTKLALS